MKFEIPEDSSNMNPQTITLPDGKCIELKKGHTYGLSVDSFDPIIFGLFAFSVFNPSAQLDAELFKDVGLECIRVCFSDVLPNIEPDQLNIIDDIANYVERRISEDGNIIG